ncbi:hypothetical protein PN462_00610 [Spirulina sp. CS-785/01]|uniref:hypothetical protein n=1 Tax=Spirulina sp. CS-785/01 TaxID=3021716 RepID=UPI00232B94E8|nr:hypothetical protein [Spirulina sp. CS-785/01]MDB9311582.1 hypothetical protein [Spirulina sp. CS-785/01]
MLNRQFFCRLICITLLLNGGSLLVANLHNNPQDMGKQERFLNLQPPIKAGLFIKVRQWEN